MNVTPKYCTKNNSKVENKLKRFEIKFENVFKYENRTLLQGLS